MSEKRRPRRKLAITPLPELPPDANPELLAAVRALVDKQLASQPDVRAAFERLVAAGHSPEGARQTIVHVIARELFPTMARGEHYDERRLHAALAELGQTLRTLG